MSENRVYMSALPTLTLLADAAEQDVGGPAGAILEASGSSRIEVTETLERSLMMVTPLESVSPVLCVMFDSGPSPDAEAGAGAVYLRIGFTEPWNWVAPSKTVYGLVCMMAASYFSRKLRAEAGMD